MRISFGVIVVGAAALSGCSGVSATQVGQTAGTIAGAALIPGIGAPIGTLIGTLAGLVIEQQVDKSREQQERTVLTDQLKRGPASPGAASTGPFLGVPTRVWVDERVENGRLLAGRFEVRPVP